MRLKGKGVFRVFREVPVLVQMWLGSRGSDHLIQELVPIGNLGEVYKVRLLLHEYNKNQPNCHRSVHHGETGLVTRVVRQQYYLNIYITLFVVSSLLYDEI